MAILVPKESDGFLLVAHHCHKKVLTLTIEVTSHTESHNQCFSIEMKAFKKK